MTEQMTNNGWAIPGKVPFAIVTAILVLAVAILAYHLWTRLPPIEERVGPAQTGAASPADLDRAADLARDNDKLADRIAELRQQLAAAPCPPGTRR